MKIEIDEKAAILAAVDRAVKDALSPAKLDALIQKRITDLLECLTAKDAAKHLKIGIKKFRGLGLPVANIGEKTARYRVSKIDEYLTKIET